MSKTTANQPQVKRQPRTLTKEEKAYVLSLKREDITYDLLKSLFAFNFNEETKEDTCRFLPNDRFTLNKNAFYNANQLDTTIGKYIFNLFILSPKVLELIGYHNAPITKKGFGKLQDEMSRLLLEDKITTDDVADYIDRCQWLGFRISRFMLPSATQQLLIPDSSIEEKKKELLEKYKKAIEDKDVLAVAKLEKELIEFSKAVNQSIPDMILYDSGAANYGNVYKNTSLMRGLIRNSGTGEVIVSTSSLADGIKPEEMPMYADLMVQASSSRALQTRLGGYEAKKMITAFQDLKLGEKGSDCGTTLTNEVEITKENKDLFLYRYIVDKKTNHLILLDAENINSYVGKIVNMRSPMYCRDECYCSKCMGELFYMLGVENFGILLKRISTRIMNLALKQFHDMTIHTKKFELDDYIE